ncbi:hypothetical protein GQ600_19162 [Phytophthora cactorum]|nr:hypothetical protein GQ600_19162 [Phytophthora cactorum]
MSASNAKFGFKLTCLISNVTASIVTWRRACRDTALQEAPQVAVKPGSKVPNVDFQPAKAAVSKTVSVIIVRNVNFTKFALRTEIILTAPEKTDSDPQNELTNFSVRRLLVNSVGDIRLSWYANPARTLARKLQQRQPQSINGPPLRDAALRSCGGSGGKNAQT